MSARIALLTLLLSLALTLIRADEFGAVVFAAPRDITVECGSSTKPDATGLPSVVTGLDDDNFVVSYRDEFIPSCGMTGKIIRTWTGQNDRTKATFVETQIITVVDSVPPDVIAPPSTTIECGETIWVSIRGFASARDECDPEPRIVHNDYLKPGACESVVTRTWIATDACGNSASSVQQITRLHVRPPTLHNVPANFSQECGDPLPPVNQNITASDGCTPTQRLPVRYTVLEGPGPEGGKLISRVWEATDACEHSTRAMQVITLHDTEPPIVSQPLEDWTLEHCDDALDPLSLGSWPNVTDRCDASPALYYQDTVQQDSEMQIITRTWTVMDDAGNEVQVVQHIDAPLCVEVPREKRAFTIPIQSSNADMVGDKLITSQALYTAGMTAVITSVSATSITFTTSPLTISGSTIAGMHTVSTETMTPAGGTQQPILPDGKSKTLVTIESVPGFESLDIDAKRAVLAILRGSGYRLLNPFMELPPDVSLDCHASTLPSSTGIPIVGTTCETAAEIEYSDRLAPSCGAGVTVKRTWTASDACGGKATGVQTLHLKDQSPPILSVPPNITVEAPLGHDISITGRATAVDACDHHPSVVFSDSVTPGSCEDTYTITRTWYAQDVCGNTARDVQLITVRDTTPPIVIPPPDIEIEVEAVPQPFSSDDHLQLCLRLASVDRAGRATVTDKNDPAPVVTFKSLSFLLDGALCNITRTWTAVDRCGNQAAGVVQRIAVVDRTPPVLRIPKDAQLKYGFITEPTFTGMAMASDNNIAPMVTYSDKVSHGSNSHDTLILRTWRAVDVSGNQATGVQVINMTDPAIPSIIPAVPELCLWPPDSSYHCWDRVDTTDVFAAAALGFQHVTRRVTNCTSSDAGGQESADCMYNEGRLCMLAACSGASNRMYQVTMEVSADGHAAQMYTQNVVVACSCVDCSATCIAPNNQSPHTGALKRRFASTVGVGAPTLEPVDNLPFAVRLFALCMSTLAISGFIVVAVKLQCGCQRQRSNTLHSNESVKLLRK